MVNTLEQRVKVIEDTLEIMKLKARYCTACDGGWDGPTHDYDALANLFVEDAIWDSTPLVPLLEGREAIRSFMKTMQAAPFAMHHATNPIIDVNGDSATGRWNLILLLTTAENKATWVGAVYNESYVRTAEGWRFKHLKATIATYAPYESGWAAVSVPATSQLGQIAGGIQ